MVIDPPIIERPSNGDFDPMFRDLLPAGNQPNTGMNRYFPPANDRPSSDIIDPPLYDRPVNGNFDPMFQGLLPAGNQPNTGANRYFPPASDRPAAFPTGAVDVNLIMEGLMGPGLRR